MSLPAALPLPDAEVCAVLANLIDNALTACDALPAPRRFVRVSALERAGFVVLAVRNPVDEGSRLPGDRSKRGWQLGSSALLPEHGWGIDIVEDIARAHEGSLTFEVEQADGQVQDADEARQVLVARVILRAQRGR